MPPKGSKKVKSETKKETKKDNDDNFSDISDDDIDVDEQEFPEDGDVDDRNAEELVDEEDEEEEEEGALVIEDDEPVIEKNTRTYTIVDPEDRETSSRLTRFECARIIGERAIHIDNGALIYVDIGNSSSSIDIAYRELMARVVPMAVIRDVGNEHVEIWKVREMSLPHDLPNLEKFIR